MKVTRDILDNGKHIVHINYEKTDLEKARKRLQEYLAKKQLTK